MATMNRIAMIALLFSASGAIMAWGDDSECLDARSSARSAAEDVSYYSEVLKSCADGRDLLDDCSFEFGRLRWSYEEYEDAVGRVSYECP
jgi:hypothetical protein